jgi:hypothetical protein
MRSPVAVYMIDRQEGQLFASTQGAAKSTNALHGGSFQPLPPCADTLIETHAAP